MTWTSSSASNSGTKHSDAKRALCAAWPKINTVPNTSANYSKTSCANYVRTSGKMGARTEGVYVSTIDYPDTDNPNSRRLYAIEKVYGNDEVERVLLTWAEARIAYEMLGREIAQSNLPFVVGTKRKT